jgi:hypothetical protein
MEGVEGNFVKKEICVVIPNRNVLVHVWILITPMFELLLESSDTEVDRRIREFYVKSIESRRILLLGRVS